jgi:hypothetical protein
MPKSIVDKTNRRYGRLLVVERDFSKTNGTYWICRCDCGKTKSVNTMQLNNSGTKSCGCLADEILKGNQKKTHGETETRLYSIWRGMKKRCYQKSSAGYRNYGGRGISVCEDWICSYENFRDWAILNGYKDDLTLDRIDSNGNYEPSNCRFSTYFQQANNKRTNRIITYKNVQLTLAQWCVITNIPKTTLCRKISKIGEECAIEWALSNNPRNKSGRVSVT